MGTQPGFFDVDHRMKRVSDLGDQLEAFGSAVDFEIFCGDLVLAPAYSENGQGGRPPFDPVIMFKILVIQAGNNLSDERTEFLINDRKQWAPGSTEIIRILRSPVSSVGSRRSTGKIA